MLRPNCFWCELVVNAVTNIFSGGARSRNLGGHLRGNAHFREGKIEFHEMSPPPRCQNFWPPGFFPYIFSEIFFRTFLIFSRPLKIVPAYQNFSRTYQKFFTDLPKIFHGPTKNFSQTYQKCNFLATFHKFLQFCLSNSDVSTTFGHFSQKSPFCRCGSYTHGSQRLMVSTENIKNWGGGAKWGAENNFGGTFAPPCSPLAPPLNILLCKQSINVVNYLLML